MKTFSMDGFCFSFQEGPILDLYAVDDKDKNSPHFHNAPMKTVDFIIELEKKTVFVEVKDFSKKPSAINFEGRLRTQDKKPKSEEYKKLKETLIYKFRDTFLCRHLEDADHKEIIYLCLLNSVNAPTCSYLSKELQREIPVGMDCPRWKKGMLSSCQVFNVELWNKSFKNWSVKIES